MRCICSLGMHTLSNDAHTNTQNYIQYTRICTHIKHTNTHLHTYMFCHKCVWTNERTKQGGVLGASCMCERMRLCVQCTQYILAYIRIKFNRHLLKRECINRTTNDDYNKSSSDSKERERV